MKLNGSRKINASSTQVFDAILNPTILQASIPGCESISYVDANTLQANIGMNLPGLKGPFGLAINITRKESPNLVELVVKRETRAGSVNATATITLTDDAGATDLGYNANADLTGVAAVFNNPIGQGFAKNSLDTFFKNLDAAIVK